MQTQHKGFTYSSIHQRLHRLSPIPDLCACGQPAREWALRHDAPAICTDVTTGLLFSPDLAAYERQCRKCHRRMDGNAQKMWDRDHAGRAAKQAKGENHWGVVLTAQDVSDIRSRRQNGEILKHLSRAYGVSMAQISRITNGQSWRHLK